MTLQLYRLAHTLHAHFLQKTADLTKKTKQKKHFWFQKGLFCLTFRVCTVACGLLLMMLQLYRLAHTFHTLCCTVAIYVLTARYDTAFIAASYTNLAHTLT